jgi:hypothetical protein
MDSSLYEYKYLKYKIKYLQYKIMIGGELKCECVIKEGDKEIKDKKCSCNIDEDPKLNSEGLKKYKKIKQQIEKLEKEIKKYKHDKKMIINNTKYKLLDYDDEEETKNKNQEKDNDKKDKKR